MDAKPLELRRWFTFTVMVAAYVASTACLLLVWLALPAASSAIWALLLLYLGATSGLMIVFGRLLPLVLVRIWPRLDG